MRLRTRLTLGYTLVLGVVLIAFGTLVFISLSFSMTAQIEGSLTNTADNILLASGMPETLAITLRGVGLTSNVFVQVWSVSETGERTLVWQSIDLPAREGFDPEALNATENVFTSSRVGQYHLRVLTVPLVSGDEGVIAGYLQLAAPLDSVDRAKQMLLYVLIGGGLLATGTAAFVGWGAARAALRPLDEVTEAAERITRADDLSRRLPLNVPPDGEVGRLILAFNQTLERLENLFEAQRRLLADVSHELRTPLTTIRGNADLIRRMGEADAESLEAITGEVDRMTRMVQDLLLLAKAESGHLPLAQEVVELDTLLLEVYHQAKILAQGKVELRLGEEDQARTVGDRDRLKQVLLNLVANAIEHSPQGGEVTMSLRCEARVARLAVADQGEGIPQEEVPRIFARFYRRDPSRKRSKNGGAGLGLPIAYWITRSHGGHIEVESEVGKGTTFVVILPREGEGCGSSEAGEESETNVEPERMP
jgi:two-component system OmpR family sensor kinase